MLHNLSLGLKNLKLLPHRWQNHIGPDVDIRTNRPLVVWYLVGPVFVNLRQLAMCSLRHQNNQDLNRMRLDEV